MKPIVRVEEVTKRFSDTVYDRFNLTVMPNQTVCILAPNGVGKTTLLKMIAGIMHPNKGTIYVNDYPVGPFTKGFVSYMEEHPSFPKWMSVKDLVDFYQDNYADFNKEQCMNVLLKTTIRLTSKIKSLSKGMKEQLQFALISSRDAILYLLDEPFGGVDIVAREGLMKQLANLKKENKSIIVTTHYPEIMIDLFDVIIIMSRNGVEARITQEDLKVKSLVEIYKEIVYREMAII